MSSPPSNEPSLAEKERQLQQQAINHKNAHLVAVPVDPTQPQGRATVGEAVKMIKPDDFLKVHQVPCGREGMLTGIGGGAAIGGIRYITGSPIPKATNWAVGGFILGALIGHEYCQYQRRVERYNMKRVVEVVSKKQAEEKEVQERRQQLQQRKEEAERLAAQKSWYKFW